MKGKTASKIILHTDLQGKDWMYNNNIYHVLAVEDNGTRIVTDKRTFKFSSEEERDYFLATLLPADVPPTAPPAKYQNGSGGVSIVADKDSPDLFIKMLGELQEDFDKMKEDPSYVPVAKQRANQVNTMTNLVKTKIALEKLNMS